MLTLFKKKCKHPKIKHITDLGGDSIERFGGRSIWKCIECGKEIIHSTRSNEDINHEINKRIIDKGDISDGYHTFDELYFHRMMLFSVVCNQNKDRAWKSKLHDDGTMYDDYFIVGIETDQGQYTYHYHMQNWSMFKVKELDKAPEWDGHKPSDIVRLISLTQENLK